MDYDEWNSCHRKVRYGRRKTAKSAVLAMRAKGALNLHAYECRYCDGWHIGHKRSVLFNLLWRLLPRQIVRLRFGAYCGWLTVSMSGKNYKQYKWGKHTERCDDYSQDSQNEHPASDALASSSR